MCPLIGLFFKGLGLVIKFTLSISWIIWKAARTYQRIERTTQRIPPMINENDPAILEAERVVEKHLAKERKEHRNGEV